MYELHEVYRNQCGMTTADHPTFQRKRIDLGRDLFTDRSKAERVISEVFAHIAELKATRTGKPTTDTIIGVPFTVKVSKSDRFKRPYLPEDGEYLLPLRSEVMADLLLTSGRSFINGRGEFLNLCIKMQVMRLQDCSAILAELGVNNWGDLLHRLSDVLIAETDTEAEAVKKATKAYGGQVYALKQGVYGRTHGGKITVNAHDLLSE